MVRPRKKGWKDLPTNLYVKKIHNGMYYQYKHPETGKFHGIGFDKREAVEVANTCNARLMPKFANKTNQILCNQTTFGDFLKNRFEKEILPSPSKKSGKKLSPKTLSDYSQKLIYINQELGNLSPDSIGIKEVANFLKKFPSTQSNRYRSLLIIIFDHAIAEGVRNIEKGNPANYTISRTEEVKRKRLCIEGYKMVWEHASAPVRNAMDIALYTLQRREDISAIRWQHVNKLSLEIIQSKTGTPVLLNFSENFKLSDLDYTFAQVLLRCKDGILSPWVIHHPLETNKVRRGKKFNPDSITKGFAKAREKSKYYANLKPEERPTFHEIRALGADLYSKMKKDPQLILGHKDRKMTELYLDRHGEIKWQKVNIE